MAMFFVFESSVHTELQTPRTSRSTFLPSFDFVSAECAHAQTAGPKESCSAKRPSENEKGAVGGLAFLNSHQASTTGVQGSVCGASSSGFGNFGGVRRSWSLDSEAGGGYVTLKAFTSETSIGARRDLRRSDACLASYVMTSCRSCSGLGVQR